MTSATATSTTLAACVAREALAARVAAIARLVVPRMTTLPILSEMRLVGEGDTLWIEATNLDVYVRAAVPAAAASGSMTAPARRLAALLGALPADTVSFENGRLRAGAIMFSLETCGGDLPEPAELDWSGPLSWAPYCDALTRAAWACSDSENRPILHGVHLVREGGEIVAVATNGHQLALQRYGVEGGPEGLSVIIEPGFVKVARRLVTSDAVEIGTRANWIGVRSADALVIGRCIEGRYPDCRKVIPGEWSGSLSIDQAELTAAATRMQAFAGKDHPTHRTKISLRQGQPVRARMSFPDLGRYEEVLRGGEYEGPEIEIHLDARLLQPLAHHAPAGRLIGRVKAAERPMLLQAEADPGWTGLIMPLRQLD